MTNTLGFYNPAFYANEALIQLEKALGMANTIHRGYDEERRTFGLGDTINIRRPGTFTARDAPSTAQDVTPDSVQISLNQWKEVKFKLTDKELAYTGDRIIQEHIRPAAVALADNIDTALAGLSKEIPWFHDVASTPGVSDITAVRKIMFDNKVPLRDPSMLWFMVDGQLESDFLNLEAFTQFQGSGLEGVEAQRTGNLPRKFGFGFFANQNVQTHVKGTASTDTLAVSGTTAAGETTINLSASSVTGTLVPGDTFVIAGNTQRYAITNTTTASGNAFTGVTFTPALVAEAPDGAVVTVSLDDHVMNIAYHRNMAALAMARLPDHGNELGARVASIQDPITGLALRSRLYYVGDSSEVHVALDVLYGFKMLDPNLGVRARG